MFKMTQCLEDQTTILNLGMFDSKESALRKMYEMKDKDPENRYSVFTIYRKANEPRVWVRVLTICRLVRGY